MRSIGSADGIKIHGSQSKRDRALLCKLSALCVRAVDLESLYSALPFPRKRDAVTAPGRQQASCFYFDARAPHFFFGTQTKRLTPKISFMCGSSPVDTPANCFHVSCVRVPLGVWFVRKR